MIEILVKKMCSTQNNATEVEFCNNKEKTSKSDSVLSLIVSNISRRILTRKKRYIFNISSL